MNSNPKIVILTPGREWSEPFLISLDGDGSITRSAPDQIEDNDILSALHEGWNIILYCTSNTNHIAYFEERIAKLLEQENEPPLVFINKDEPNLLDAQRIEAGTWSREFIGNSRYRMSPELAIQLDRLGSKGVPVSHDKQPMAWSSKFNQHYDSLRSLAVEGKLFTRDNVSLLLREIWETEWEYYRAF